MPLYKSIVSTTREKEKKNAVLEKYCVPLNPQIDDTDLWAVPLPEYIAYKHPKIILKIFEVDGPQLHYLQIQELLIELNVPIYCGMIFQAIYELERSLKIKEISKHVWRLVT